MAAIPSLALTTRLFVRELSDGTCIASPAVEPKLASHGDEASALLEQSLFLREHLARSSGEVIARFAVPASARLVEIDAMVPREDLPRRIAFERPVTFACVVLPSGEDEAWVAVPALDHVLFVRKGEDLEEVTRAEIRRVALARDLSPFEHARLFPAQEHRLEPLVVDLPEGAGVRSSGGQSRAKQISDLARRERAVRTLAGIGVPLHIEAAKTPPPLVGRERELADLDALLSGKERLGALLVGPENAGKSALVRAWIARAASAARDAAKTAGKGAGKGAARTPLVYQTSGAQLIAGMSGFGQWQERIAAVLDAAEAIDAILYFEDMADLLAERAGGGVDFPGAMKPYLEDDRVRVVGEIRPDGLDEAERKHPALLASLHRQKVEPLDAATTQEALRARVTHDARHEPDRPALDPAAIAPLVDLAERYLPYGAFPGKAIRLYEDLRAIREGEGGAAGARPVKLEDVYELFSRETGVPAFLLRESTKLSQADVEAALARLVVGQRQAIRRLAETIVVIKAGLQPPGKPLASFLFVGPTGVGKTELAKSLALYLFGSAEKLARFDMSEFMTPDAAERLIRGTDRGSGVLTRAVREQPFCVVLLDEIEKAHPAVFDLLLQVAGEGRLTDARGQTTSFQNTILILTSNLGSAERRAEVGFGDALADSGAREGAEPREARHYTKHVEASFRPELVNRLDRIIVFTALDPADVRAVTDLALDKIRMRPGLVDAGVAITVSDAAKEALARGGYSKAMGARALRRHLEEVLVAPASRLLGKMGGDMAGAAVDVSAVSEGLVRDAQTLAMTDSPSDVPSIRLRVRRRRRDLASRDVQSTEGVGQLRRFVDRVMRLDAVGRVADRVATLTTQLAAAETGKHDRRKEADIAQMMAEHHRLGELWKRLHAAQLDVHSAEELALLGLFDGAPLEPILSEARDASLRFRRALPYVMLALEVERDRITLMLEELDKGAYDVWLPPLLALCERRRWQVILHLDGGARTAEDRWPPERRWGPPRSPDEIRKALADEGRRFRNVLLRVTGSFAGVMLGLEQGLHRITGVPRAKGDGRLCVCVHFVAMHVAMKDADWSHPSFEPPAIATADARRKGQAAREFDEAGKTVSLLAKRVTLPGDVASFFEDHDLFAAEHLLAKEPDAKLARDTRSGRKAG
jgi:ATP-dependent Clp protease ATP-binding subunit ClpC